MARTMTLFVPPWIMNPPIITLSSVRTTLRLLMLRNLEGGIVPGVEIVHFHEADSSRVVYTPHDRCVVTRRQVCDDRRFQSVARSVPAVHDVTDLVLGDNSTDDRLHPVVIRSD